MLRAVLFAILIGAPLAAQGTTPRASAAEYPAHATVGELSLGAEYLVRSIPAAEGMLYSPGYLVGLDLGRAGQGTGRLAPFHRRSARTGIATSGFVPRS
jgi:hypothetical protein